MSQECNRQLGKDSRYSEINVCMEHNHTSCKLLLLFNYTVQVQFIAACHSKQYTFSYCVCSRVSIKQCLHSCFTSEHFIRFVRFCCTVQASTPVALYFNLHKAMGPQKIQIKCVECFGYKWCHIQGMYVCKPG